MYTLETFIHNQDYFLTKKNIDIVEKPNLKKSFYKLFDKDKKLKHLIYQNNNFEKTLKECVDSITYNIDSSKSILDEDYTSDLYVLDKIKQNINIPISKKNNLIKFSDEISRKLVPFIMEIYPEYSIIPSGFFLYPPGGFMGWHTNSDFPCLRIYITYVKEINKSGFRYVDNIGNIITDIDKDPITIREFSIEKNPLFWHCVYSDTMRYSFGFRLETF